MNDRSTAATNGSTAALAGAGAVSGLIAALAMALAAMFYAMANGFSFWFPMEQISGLFLGVDALLGGWGPAILGIVIHFGTGMVYGLIFGVIFGRLTSVGGSFVVGVVYAVAIWALMTYLVLPEINSTMGVRVALIPIWWFAYHLFYGATLGLTPLFRQSLAGRPAIA